MEDRVDISIVVPVFNAAMTLETLCERTVAVLQNMVLNYEIIFVDDGSLDQSWEIITSLKAQYESKVSGIQLSRNYGQQVSTMCGLQRARGTWIVTLDDDMQIAPEQIDILWKRMKSSRADVIYGAYTQPKHGWIHNTGTRIFHGLLKMVAPDRPRGSSFRLIRSDILKLFPVHLGPWIFIDPILAWLSSSIVSVPVTHEKKNHGKSTYSFFKLLSLACQALIIYSNKPFRLIIWIALLGAVVSFVIGVYFIIQKFTIGSQLGFSAIIVTISFASSMILFSLGMIGEYIYRIYGMNTGRPAFTIKKLA